MNEYIIHLLIYFGIYLILAQSFNITFGLGHIVNLAHIASFAIGAYTTAILSTNHAFNFFSCTILSMCSALIVSLILGIIASRIKGDYFILGSLAFYYIVLSIIINWRSFTNGVLGISGISRPVIFDIEIYNNFHYFLLVLAYTIPSLIIIYVIINSPLARTLKAQAEFEPATLSLGRNVSLSRNFSLLISSAFAGLAGSLLAFYIGFIDPTSFGLPEIIYILSIIILGKPGSFWGVTASTLFLILLPEVLRFTNLPSELIGPLRNILYSLILYLVLYKQRKVLFPIARRV
jgi:branched-chain amino acid transport system permease protein